VSLEAAVVRAVGRPVRGLKRVAGGDINDAYTAELGGGGRVFVKTRAGAPPGEYASEAAALDWLAEPAALGVPEVLGVLDGPDEPRLLALEWLDAGPAGDEAQLGRGLATVHAAGADAFGGASPLRIGPLALPNDPLPEWPEFYAERRLRPLLAPARDRGALTQQGARAVERLCDRIGEAAGPAEPPARLHGDLWSGNVLWSGGRPFLIDPIAYGGHREVDLAMLRLFAAPAPRLLAAYEEVAPLAAGHEDRVALWQLFPLLVHAVLFGGSYGASVERAARRYAG
jgi:fructosamine-3-kinase